jgi:hypothetical protein
MPGRTGHACCRRAQAGAQPTNLAAVIDLVLGDMEPRPVCIHCGGSAERSLQPGIIARGKALESGTAYRTERAEGDLETEIPR